jgi:hypothetical protein
VSRKTHTAWPAWKSVCSDEVGDTCGYSIEKITLLQQQACFLTTQCDHEAALLPLLDIQMSS